MDYGSVAPWSWNQESHHIPSSEEISADLDLDPARWRAERLDTPRREATGPNGEKVEIVDTVVVVCHLK